MSKFEFTSLHSAIGNHDASQSLIFFRKPAVLDSLPVLRKENAEGRSKRFERLYGVFEFTWLRSLTAVFMQYSDEGVERITAVRLNGKYVKASSPMPCVVMETFTFAPVATKMRSAHIARLYCTALMTRGY